MTPNEPIRSLAGSCTSPFSAFFAYIALLSLYITVSAAQTRLDSTQVAPLKGATEGSLSTTKVRDLNSAADHGDGVTNGIASAIGDCGTTISCSIIVPPSYGTTEQVPGYHLNPTTASPAAVTPGNISIFDRRYSDARMSVNQYGFAVGFIHTPAGWLYNYYSNAAQNAHLIPFALRSLSLDGGANQQASALSYADKTKWAAMLTTSISHTPGQHVSTTIVAQNTSLGDSSLITNKVTCFGGYATEGDQGCRAVDNIVAQGNVEYSGTLIGSPYPGATAVTVAPTQGSATQGSERFLVRINAGTISAGTISQVSSTPNATSVTGLGTSWPVSSVIGTLGTDVTAPGSAVVAPTGFSTGGMSGIQTSSLICVADQGGFEMVTPLAVTASTFTANFHTVHPGNARISVGGLCGYLLDLTADDVTDASYPVKLQTIVGTLHFAFPVMSSPSSTSAELWVQADGSMQQPTTRWKALGPNGYVLYPYADVWGTQQAGRLSDTLTLGPNNVAWAAGDTVSEFLYPSFHATFGNNFVEGYYPNAASDNGFSLTYNMPLQGNDAMVSLNNNGPAGIYAANGGRFFAPFGLHLSGPTSKSVVFDQPSDNAAVAVGCASPCSSLALYMAAANSAFYDFLTYDQGAKHWNLSANVYSAHYSLAATRFDVPFANTFVSNDSNGLGYVATHELRSNASSNTDLSGELVFNTATTLTQALQGSYSNHPECLARPQFDTGSTNRYWISYAAGSFTINFANPVSGTVSYSCVARN